MKMWCPKLHKNHGWPLKIDSIPSSALFLLLLLFLLRLLLLGLRQRTPDPRNKAHAVKGMFCRTAAKTGIPLAAGVRGWPRSKRIPEKSRYPNARYKAFGGYILLGTVLVSGATNPLALLNLPLPHNEYSRCHIAVNSGEKCYK